MSPPDVTYLGDEFTREILTHLLGADTGVLPIPTDEASCEYLRGRTLIIVPRNDQDRASKSTAYFLRSLRIPCTVSPVSIRWIVTDDRVPFSPDKLRALLAGEAQKQSAPPLTIEQTNITWLNGYQRKEIPMILDNLLPQGIVGGINAEGGTGKTFLLISLFAALSTGLPWGPFVPTRPYRVLLLLAEDPEDVVRNRVYDTCLQIHPDFHALLATNFHVKSVRGISGPLLGLEGGNPAPTAWTEWLVGSIHEHPGVEVLGLDPLRKFYGLEENRNEFAHAFIGLLEKLSLDHALTILYNHHVAKAVRGAEVGQITGRGAGGLSDNCRWMAAMRTVNEKLAEELDLDDAPQSYVEFAVTKNNYAPLLPAPVYFRRGMNGILEPLDVKNDRKAAKLDYLITLIAGQDFSLRDLLNGEVCSEIRDQMKARFDGWKRGDFHIIVGYGIKTKKLLEEQRGSGLRGRRKSVLVVADEAMEEAPF